MAFLKNLILNLKRGKQATFKETVKKEKSQKYLLDDLQRKNRQKKVWDSLLGQKKGGRFSPIRKIIEGKLSFDHKFTDGEQLAMKGLGIFLIATTLYIFFYSPYFLLSPSKIMIESLDETVDVSIAYRSIEGLYGKNVFFIDQKMTAEAIQSDQKNITSIRINHLYPNNLKITLFGQAVEFIVSIQDRGSELWGMTLNGILIPIDRIKVQSGLTKMVVIDDSLTEDFLLDYHEIIPSERVLTISKMYDSFSELWPELKIGEILYLRKENEVHFILANNTRVIFTLQDFTKKTGEVVDYKHLMLQYSNLKTFIESRKDDVEKGAYTYIDARIPNRIFSCRDTTLCMKNLLLIYPDLKEKQ